MGRRAAVLLAALALEALSSRTALASIKGGRGGGGLACFVGGPACLVRLRAGEAGKTALHHGGRVLGLRAPAAGGPARAGAAARMVAGGADGEAGGMIPSGQDEGDEDLGFAHYLAGGVDRLLSRLRTGDVASEEGREGARKSIIELEQQRNFPFDPGFFSLAVSGAWELLYSTSRVGVPDPSLKVRRILSELNGLNKTLTHKVLWEYSEQLEGGGTHDTKGVFDISCVYNLSEVPSVPTRMIIAVEEYRLTCQPVKNAPKDPQGLVAALQRALPREFFDPDEALMDTTYLDPNVRLVCYLGKRFAGVRHVYTREGVPAELSALSEASQED